MKRFLGISLVLFTLSLLVNIFAIGSLASAASPYDNVVPDLTYEEQGFMCGGTFYNFQKLTQMARNEDPDLFLWTPEAADNYIIMLDNAIDTGTWGVRQYDETNYGTTLDVFMSPSPTQADFGMIGSNPRLFLETPNNDIYLTTFDCFTPQDKPRVISSLTANSLITVSSPAFGYYLQFISGNVTVNYPAGYEGNPINDTPLQPPNFENLKPEIAYTVNEDGLLTWQYMNNLRPFLTGTFYTNIDLLNSDWSLNSTLTTVTSQPAGWLNEEYTLPSAGRYMLYITHNQQFDDPPWTNQDFYIPPIALQFEWDGKSFLSGSNVNCDILEVCNPFNQTDPTKQGLFSSLNLPTYGLDQAVKAPLAFLSSLPEKLASDSCSPLQLPLPYLSENLELPCMRTIYQTHFSLIYNLWSTIVIALFSYGMAINLFARIKKDVNPKDDSIEAVKL